MITDTMKCDIPEGESGNVKVKRFVVSEKEADIGRMMSAFSHSSRGRYVPAGSYTKLTVDGYLVMTDTPDELRDHLGPVSRAQGICLVTGLGLGCVVRGMLMMEKVEKVIVIEKNEHVIKLVGEHMLKQYPGRLEIRHADALTYKPPKGEFYNYVWHDIWPDICDDNLDTMATLHRKYGRRCGWQDSWQRSWLKDRRRRERSWR